MGIVPRALLSGKFICALLLEKIEKIAFVEILLIMSKAVSSPYILTKNENYLKRLINNK